MPWGRGEGSPFWERLIFLKPPFQEKGGILQLVSAGAMLPKGISTMEESLPA